MENNQINQQPKKSKKVPIIIGIIVVLVAIFFILLTQANKNLDTKNVLYSTDDMTIMEKLAVKIFNRDFYSKAELKEKGFIKKDPSEVTQEDLDRAKEFQDDIKKVEDEFAKKREEERIADNIGVDKVISPHDLIMNANNYQGEKLHLKKLRLLTRETKEDGEYIFSAPADKGLFLNLKTKPGEISEDIKEIDCIVTVIKDGPDGLICELDEIK